MEKRENKDGKLVRLAQSGDNDAMEQLCAEYKDTVRMLARPYFLIGADRDDLIQEGMGPSAAETTRIAPSIWAAPVIMFLT